jgi:LCP family protein required for cell wall assembly
MKINGVFGEVKLDRMKELVEQEGMDPAKAEPQATAAAREALIATVAKLTGVTVDHYAEIGLLGFALITDALGGVDVCLKDAVYEPLSGADFPAGWQKLDGPQALSFVRQRHDLPRRPWPTRSSRARRCPVRRRSTDCRTPCSARW